MMTDQTGCPVQRGVCPAHVPGDLIIPYDYVDEAAIRDHLWEMAADMADKPEIFWSPDRGGYWVVTSAAAFEAITERPDLFSSRAGTIPSAPDKPLFIPSSLDPPAHTLYRKVMAQRMFSARALANLEDMVEGICASVIDEFAAQGECDFVQAFAKRVPVDLFLTMMGASPDKRDSFLSWVEKTFRANSVEELQEGYAEANAFATQWLDEQIAQGDNHGQLFTAMRDAEIDGRPITYDEMHNMTIMLFLGGLDTVVSQLTHIARHLAENPEQQALLAAQPERLPGAMEELLRRFGITNFVREAREDMEFHGVQFRKGDLLLLSTPFANLDRRAFDDPLKVDFDRARRVRHWTFGHGIHLCIGAHLARVQVLTSMRHMLRRLPDMRLQEGVEPQIISGGTFAVRSLPIRWTVPG